jgi:hypothetical protein
VEWNPSLLALLSIQDHSLGTSSGLFVRLACQILAAFPADTPIHLDSDAQVTSNLIAAQKLLLLSFSKDYFHHFVLIRLLVLYPDFHCQENPPLKSQKIVSYSQNAFKLLACRSKAIFF